jgi:hypothetical protein
VGEQIVGEGKSGGEQLAAPGGAILWQLSSREDEIGFRDEVAERDQ